MKRRTFLSHGGSLAMTAAIAVPWISGINGLDLGYANLHFSRSAGQV